MERWKIWTSLLFAIVLCLGMVGVAAADPPDPHPACEKENPPPGCEDDGHPGNPDEDDGEGDENPLAPLGEVCSQVVQAIAEGDPTGQAIELHALCEALGAEPLEDDDGEEPEEPEDPGEEESPTQPIADACNEFVSQLVDNGAPAEAEQARELCDQFGDRPEDGDGEEPEEPEDPGEEESPTQPIADGCNQVIDELVDGGAPAELEEGRQVCGAFGSQSDDGDGDDGEGDEGDGSSPLAEGCNQVVDGLVGVSEEFEQGRALCEQAP